MSSTIKTLLSLLSISHSLTSEDCKFTLIDSNNVESDYDLSQFHFTGKDGKYLHEVDDVKNTDFVYKFNICGSIPEPMWVKNTSIPSYCLGSDKGPCIDFTDYKNGTVICNEIYPDTSTTLVPSAVQIETGSKGCYWLGMELSEKYVNTTQFPNYRADLLDSDNSGAGIVFNILNGQFCSSGHDMNRQLSISLKCPDSTRTEWDTQMAQVITEPVIESSVCVYELAFESPLACPKQCISHKSHTNTYAVCSTHGICTADPNAGHSRCICDNGFGGDLCENIVSGVDIIDVGNEDLMTAIVICIVVTVICGGIAVYLWYNWRKTHKMARMMGGSHEHFLMIDDEVEEDDDTLNAGRQHKKRIDTFHPVLSADVETAMAIHIEHEKQKKHSMDSSASMEENENENDDTYVDEVVQEAHKKNIENLYTSKGNETVPADDAI